MKLILFITVLVTLAATASTRSVAESRNLTIDEVIEKARLLSGSSEEATGIGRDAKPIIIEGDIAQTTRTTGDRRKRQAIENLSQRWQNGEIPYAFGTTFTTDEMAVFNAAVSDYEQFTCVRLVPRTTQKHYVNVIKAGGCWSYVGNVDFYQSPQELSLAEGCLYRKRTAIHEFLHAAGSYHTQSRADRDGYVDIIWSNIENGKESNFNKHEKALLYGLPYDYRSVMHYGQTFFGDPRGSVTIRTKVAAYQTVIGTAQTFSMVDIKLVNEMYGCNDDCDSSIVCQEDQFLGPECKCYCASSDPAVPGVICDVQPEPTTTTAEPTTTTAEPTTTTAEPTTTTTTAAPTTTTTMPQNQCTELNKPCGCKDTDSVNSCDMLENSECKNKKDFCKCKRGFKPNSDNTGCELPECNAISIAKKSTCLCEEGKKCAGVKKTECVKKKNGGFKCKCKKPLKFRDGKCKCKDGFKFRKGNCIKK